MAGMDEKNPSFYSKVYPMPGANALAELFLKDSEDRKLRKDDSMPPLQISQEFFESAFKFLREYNNNNTQQQQLNGSKKKNNNNNNNNCVTVYSSPCGSSPPSSKRLKKVQGSTELPQSVKKMMEKDASLRRLLKTGSVTISHIPNPAKNSEDALASSSHSSSSTNGIYKVNCKSSNLLRMFAKKVAATNLERNQQRLVKEKNWSVKIVPGKNVKVVAVNETLLKNGNKNGKKSLKKLDKFLREHVHHKRYSTDSDERDAEVDQDCPEIQQPYVEGFDPTRFLEVSFREEESDEHRRKYKCPHCIKKFCWSTDLKRHILTHTGERPFSCEFCPANFTRKFLMQKHTRKHHPDQLNNGSCSIKNGNSSFSSSSTNGHVKIEPDDEVEDDEDDEEDIDQGVELDSPPHQQEEEEPPEESEQFYLPLITKKEPKPIVINVFSSMRENGHMDMMGDENRRSNIISLAAGATISTTEIKPGILTKRPSSRNNNNNGREQKLITLVNS